MNASTRRRIRPSLPSAQTDLFTAPVRAPEGFRYRADVLSAEEEEALARELARLPFKPFDFYGHQANRQVVSFGWGYDYDPRVVVETAPFPPFLLALRSKVAETFGHPAVSFRQVLHQRVSTGREFFLKR
jgi:hypothetical protein